MAILDSRELRQRMDSAWDSDNLIDDDSAQTIASLWHSPIAELSKLSHGMECDAESYGSMLIEIVQEMRDIDSRSDILQLAELYSWIRFQMAKDRING